jgi:vacuolar-type H+-ATPase subunit E/Vma4
MNNAKTLKNRETGKQELVKAIQDLITKVNDLVQHIDEPEYLVDLMPEHLVQQFGQERITETARAVLKKGVSKGLSKKFSALLHKLAERHFGSIGAEMFSPFKVSVRYRIDRTASTNMCRADGYETVLEIPASSESVMVERLVEELLFQTVGPSCFDVYLNESNRLYSENAPMTVHPETRNLSAEEFIATYKQKPRTLG